MAGDIKMYCINRIDPSNFLGQEYISGIPNISDMQTKQ